MTVFKISNYFINFCSDVFTILDDLFDVGNMRLYKILNTINKIEM